MLITKNKSIIPALDVRSLDELIRIVKVCKYYPIVGAYKVGFSMAIRYGLKYIVQTIRKHDDLRPIIYDHQKAGNDIPDMGREFAFACRDSGVNAVILFPFTGKQTLESWISECMNVAELQVIVGGEMTHEGFHDFIKEDAWQDIYGIAYLKNVKDFVVPGNNPGFVSMIKNLYPNITLYAPGFISQKGDITETGKVAGNNWHAIVGRAITASENIDVTLEMLSKTMELGTI